MILPHPSLWHPQICALHLSASALPAAHLYQCISRSVMRPYCAAQATLLSAPCWPGWEGSPERGGVTCVYLADSFAMQWKVTHKGIIANKNNLKKKKSCLTDICLVFGCSVHVEPWAWRWDLVPGGARFLPDSKNVGVLALSFLFTAHHWLNLQSASLSLWLDGTCEAL